MSHGTSAITLRLRPDPQGLLPAWARVSGQAIEHLETLDVHWQERLRAARPNAASLAALEAAFADCRVEALPSLPDGARPPLWPLRLRSGPAGDLWPFDPELVAFQIGARTLLKREAFDEDEARRDSEWLREHGLLVERAGEIDRDGRRTLLAAGNADLLRDAQALERARDERLGELLGYPSCCVAAYRALGPREDALAFAVRLGDPRVRRPPEALFLNGALALVSHLPCSADCAATLLLARSILASLGPAIEARWRLLAARVHVIDARGRSFALAIDEDRITDAIELAVPPSGSVDVSRPATIGDSQIKWHGREWHAGDLHAILIADHRG